MKRIVIYSILLASALLVPVERLDVGKLKPVGLVQIYKDADAIVIVTDSDDSGVGYTLAEAFTNLKETTAGAIFLDTADYLLIDQVFIKEIETLGKYLKPQVLVCIANEYIDSKAAAEYLSAHRPTVRLKDKTGLQNAEMLAKENERLTIYGAKKKYEKNWK